MKNQAPSVNNPQSGNAFLIILVGVMLFAALSYVVSQTMRGGDGVISSEQVKFAANQMIEYGQKLRDTVRGLIITNGCADTEITFEDTPYYTQMPNLSGYVNSSAPTSKKCHVFDVGGGGMRVITPADRINTNAFSTFDGQHCYEGHGTGTSPCPDTAKELVYNLVRVPLSVCQEVNKIAGIGVAGAAPPIEDFNYSTTSGSGPFRGTYQTTDSAATIVSGIGTSRKAFGCYQDSTGDFINDYIFYYILLAR